MTLQKIDTDIDIDFADRTVALDGLPCVIATMRNGRGQRQRHPSGVYFQDVPVDPISGLCAYEYEEASQFGFIKIDFLNNSLYENVRDEAHLDSLLSREPDWALLEHESIVEDLVHIREHFGIVKLIRPRSIEDLAVVLALVRPGKRHLIGKPRSVIDEEIWTASPEEGFVFKRAHAISYAAAIVVQMNLMCESVEDSLVEE